MYVYIYICTHICINKYCICTYILGDYPQAIKHGKGTCSHPHEAPSRRAAAPRRNTQAPCSGAIRPCPAECEPRLAVRCVAKGDIQFSNNSGFSIFSQHLYGIKQWFPQHTSRFPQQKWRCKQQTHGFRNPEIGIPCVQANQTGGLSQQNKGSKLICVVVFGSFTIWPLLSVNCQAFGGSRY